MADSPQQQKERERAFFALISRLADASLPAHNGLVCVLVSSGAVSIQGSGKVEPRELANALRAYADELDKQGANASRILMPGGSGLILPRGRA